MNRLSRSFVIHGYGEDAPWLDLVNSEHWDGFGNFTDMLNKPDWVDSFRHFWKFSVSSREPFPLEQSRTLRSLIRTLVERAAKGETLGLEQLEPLNDWMSVPLTPRLEEDHNQIRISLRVAQSGWQGALGHVAYSFALSLVEHGESRLRTCRNSDCRWIFIDQTKGNVRRWCNTATCGNRERVRKARAAKKH